MPFSTTQNRNYTPPSTGSLPTFFSGSKFSAVAGAGFTPGAPPTARNNPVPSQALGDKEQFNGSKNTGRTKSATSAAVALFSGH